LCFSIDEHAQTHISSFLNSTFSFMIVLKLIFGHV
jgi:hypothetical protein